MTEEIWELQGYEGRIYNSDWPAYEEEKTIEDMIDIGIQVNGRVRGNVKIARDADNDTAIAAAKEALGDRLTGNIVKEIYVPGRIVNIVVK